jgi:hypothetical protein
VSKGVLAYDAHVRSQIRQAFAKLEFIDGGTRVLCGAPLCVGD